MNENEISELIIGSAIEVHRILGPGLLEVHMKSVCFMNLEVKNYGLKSRNPCHLFIKILN